MKRLAYALILAAAACTTTHHEHALDAASDADTPGPNLVELSLIGGPATLFQYRDGAGPWITAQPDQSGKYPIHVTDDYMVLVVCQWTGIVANFDAEETAGTFSDGATTSVFCFGPSATGTQYHVTGTVAQAGSVSVEYSQQTSATPAWNLDMVVDPGTYDVVGLDASHISIDRTVAVAADTSLGAIDIDANGSATTAKTISASGDLAGDTVDATLYLDTAGGTIASLASGSDLNVQVPPPALLITQDALEITVEASESGTFYRYVEDYQWDGTTVDYALPAKLTGVTFAADAGTIEASWTALPAGNGGIYMAVFGGTQSTEQQQGISASASWLAKHGSTLAFDMSSPDYSSAWKLDPATSLYEFGESSYSGTLISTSQLSGQLAAGSGHRRSTRDRHAALRRAQVNGAKRKI